MKLDTSKPHAVVYGHLEASYEQNGILYDGGGNPLQPPKPEQAKAKAKEIIVEHDGVENAKEFLKNILKQGPLSKSTVFKTAEDNNQKWEHVKDAASLLNIAKVHAKGLEVWKLSDVS